MRRNEVKSNDLLPDSTGKQDLLAIWMRAPSPHVCPFRAHLRLPGIAAAKEAHSTTSVG